MLSPLRPDTEFCIFTSVSYHSIFEHGEASEEIELAHLPLLQFCHTAFATPCGLSPSSAQSSSGAVLLG